MITRRSFIAALCALPVIGKWMPQSYLLPLTTANYQRVHDAWVPMTYEGQPVYLGQTYMVAPDRTLKPMNDAETIRRLNDYRDRILIDAMKG